jgi:hypothetical protein
VCCVRCRTCGTGDDKQNPLFPNTWSCYFCAMKENHENMLPVLGLVLQP